MLVVPAVVSVVCFAPFLLVVWVYSAFSPSPPAPPPPPPRPSSQMPPPHAPPPPPQAATHHPSATSRRRPASWRRPSCRNASSRWRGNRRVTRGRQRSPGTRSSGRRSTPTGTGDTRIFFHTIRYHNCVRYSILDTRVASQVCIS